MRYRDTGSIRATTYTKNLRCRLNGIHQDQVISEAQFADLIDSCRHLERYRACYTEDNWAHRPNRPKPMPGNRLPARAAVAIDWLWSYLTYQRGARLITGQEM